MTASTHDADAEDRAALERRFEAAMYEIYERAGREVAYWATRYLQLLRRRGPLEAARYLLGTRVTSDGYARLRDAGRLDLTVEALVSQPQYASLFSEQELSRARERLAQFQAMPIAKELEPSLELGTLVDKANAAEASARIEYRDQIAAYGVPAITAVVRALHGGRSPALAIGVVEVVGTRSDPARALSALWGIRAKYPAWDDVIDQAIKRVRAVSRQ